MDIREFLFSPISELSFKIEVTAGEPGILAGEEKMRETVRDLGLQLEWVASDGGNLRKGDCVCRARGSARQVALAEEQLLGYIGKASGVATAAAEMVLLAKGKARVVCGAWKKVAPEVRPLLRRAIAIGGAGIRLIEEPFVYLDKNYIRMFGGVAPAVRRARELAGRVIVVQLRGETNRPAEEAREAAREGARVLMVDTGKLTDLAAVKEIVWNEGLQETVRIAFGGGVTKNNLAEVIAAGAEIIDVGRAIIDAPLLDFRLDVKV